MILTVFQDSFGNVLIEEAMKVQKLKGGATIEVGDMVCNDSWASKSWHKVIRTTEKFAVVAWNSTVTAKFPRVVPNDQWLRPCGKRDIWSTNQYTVWRPVPGQVEAVPETPK